MNKSLIYGSLLALVAGGFDQIQAKCCSYTTDAILANAIETNQGVQYLINNCCNCEVLPVPNPVPATPLVAAITIPGSYCLPAGFDAVTVTINASNVTLDLNGNIAGAIDLLTPQSNIVIKNGFAKTIGTATGTSAPVITNLQIEDITNDTAATFSGVTDLHISNCLFRNHAGDGLDIFACTNVEVVNCEAVRTSVANNGFVINNSINVLLKDCLAKGFSRGFYVEGYSKNVNLIGDIANQNADGFVIVPTFLVPADITAINVIDCLASENTFLGFDGRGSLLNFISCVAKGNTTKGFVFSSPSGITNGLVKECISEGSTTGFNFNAPHPGLIFVANYAANNTTNYQNFPVNTPNSAPIVILPAVPTYWNNVQG